MNLNEDLRSISYRKFERWITILGLLEDKRIELYPKTLAEKLYEFGFIGDSDNFELSARTIGRDVKEIEHILQINKTVIGRKGYRFDELKKRPEIYSEILKRYISVVFDIIDTEYLIDGLMKSWDTPLKNIVYLRIAIQNQYPVTMTYSAEKTKEITTRTVEPLKAIFNAGKPFLLAYDPQINTMRDGQIKQFILYNIQDITINSIEPFTDRNLEIQEYYKHSIYYFRRKESRATYKIKFLSKFEKQLKSFLSGKDYRMEEIDEKKHLLVTLTVDGIEELINWLWTFEDEAEILEPKNAREYYEERINKIQKIYSK